MKYTLFALSTSALLLAGCQDDTQARLAEQQKQIEALQQQLSQQQDQTVYQLNEEAVAETIPAEFQNGNNGQPVTGTDGQDYVYDASTGSWFLQSLVGAAAGAMIGNMLANKFTKAPANSAAAQRVRQNYYQSSQYRGRTSQQLNTKTVPAQQQAQQNRYRQTQKQHSNFKRPKPRMRMRRR